MIFCLLFSSHSLAETDLKKLNFDNDVYVIENYDKFKEMKSPKLALALSGGGARGFVNIGVIKALHEAGIYPDIIIGSSMGSIISTLYGSGLNVEDLIKITSTLPYSSLFDINLIPVYSLFQTRKFNYIIEKISPKKDIENFPLNTALLNFDLDSGHKYITSKGRISEILQSTYSIPFYYPINKSKGRYLVDPGLVEMVPAKAAKALSADIVIATTAFDELPYETYKYPMQSLMRMLLLVQKKNSQPILNNYSDIIIQNEVSDFSFKDFDLIEEFIKIGYINAMDKMPEIKKLLKEKNYVSTKPDFYDFDEKQYQKLNTDILFDRIIYPETYFNYLLYYFNNQSFFEQELFRNLVYDFHYGFYYENSHLKFETIFDVNEDRHTELKLRYKKLTENIDFITRLKNNPSYNNNIDYINELKYFIKNSSVSLGWAHFRNDNYYYLNNNIKLERGNFDFENNTDILLNKNKKMQLINSSLLDYNISVNWAFQNKFVYSNTNLLGDPDIYRGQDNEQKEKTSLSSSIIYRLPFSESQEFLYFFSLEELKPSLFIDIESTDQLNAALGLNLNMVSSVMGLKPLNLDLSAAYDKNAQSVIYNFSVDIKF